MRVIRTVTVLEHEVIPILSVNEIAAGTDSSNAFLAAEEAEELFLLNERRKGFCQWTRGGIKLSQYCGIVRLKTCVLEVLPKVGFCERRYESEVGRSRSALLAMLRTADGLAIANMGTAPQRTVDAPLLDVFITAFLECVLLQARRGLLGKYVSRTGELSVIKGRFNSTKYFFNSYSHPHRLPCEYEDFTLDNRYNRAIRAALGVSRDWIQRAGTRRLWDEVNTRFSGVTSQKMTAADVAQLPRDRTTRRYGPTLTWCEWLLSLSSPALKSGAGEAPAILFDMNRLFESHIGHLEDSATADERIIHRQGLKQPLAKIGDGDAFELKPDVTIWHIARNGRAGAIDRVVDAKWKRINLQHTNWGIDESDVYQMLAYAVSYNCEQLELVYPSPDEDEVTKERQLVFKIALPESEKTIQLRVRTVSLWN
jgi:5-methylcytosine-specific restriction enzyme subunit McrC